MEAAAAEISAAKSGRDAGTVAPPRRRDAAMVSGDPARGGEDALDGRLLSDVAHESRNQFHKLYYCAELVRSAVSEGATGDLAIAAEMLERTVRTLERLTAGTLDYLRPMRLEVVRMRVAEVASALAAVVRGEVGEADVRVAEAIGDGTIEIDPGRFSSALRAIAAEVAPPPTADATGCAVVVMIERGVRAGAPVAEMRFAARGQATAASERRGALVDWALATKVLHAHRGGLERGEAEGGDCVLWIPLVDEHGTRRS